LSYLFLAVLFFFLISGTREPTPENEKARAQGNNHFND